MKLRNRIGLLIGMMLIMGTAAIAQTASSTDHAKMKTAEMKTFLIEREIPMPVN